MSIYFYHRRFWYSILCLTKCLFFNKNSIESIGYFNKFSDINICLSIFVYFFLDDLGSMLNYLLSSLMQRLYGKISIQVRRGQYWGGRNIYMFGIVDFVHGSCGVKLLIKYRNCKQSIHKKVIDFLYQMTNMTTDYSIHDLSGVILVNYLNYKRSLQRNAWTSCSKWQTKLLIIMCLINAVLYD